MRVAVARHLTAGLRAGRLGSGLTARGSWAGFWGKFVRALPGAGLTCGCGARGQGCVFRQSIRRVDEEREQRVDMEFLIYGTRTSKDKSGAYLFLPDGEAQVP